MSGEDPRRALAESFRRHMGEVLAEARTQSLDASDVVATLFGWIVEIAPQDSTNEVVRGALVDAVDAFLATRRPAASRGQAPDFVLSGVEDRRRLVELTSLAPTRYQVKTDRGCWGLESQHVGRYHGLRSEVVRCALDGGFRSAELATIALELSAAIFARAMTRATFLENATVWYDSARQASPEALANSPGGTG